MAGSLRSVPDLCEVQSLCTPGADSRRPPDLLIEIPHGATRRAHYDAVRRRLTGELPRDLVDFFFVNTDVGTPEAARRVARLVVEGGGTGESSPLHVLILRGLVPRTFVDCNRFVEDGPRARVEGGVTPGMPAYITAVEDVDLLLELHRAYHDVAAPAYDLVCGAGGRALMLHSYAPRSVCIEDVDDGIVNALHRAYEPQAYARWDERPDVDVITEAEDGTDLASATWADSVVARYAEAGIRVERNGTYRLHEGTMGHRYAAEFPGQVLCVELNRARLADPFSPFREMRIGEDNVRQMADPLAAACLDELRRRG